ncbi:MAG: CBS domain-containing protein [Gaiellales bacterium]
MAVTLRDFMSGDDVLTVEPTATLAAAARSMRDRNVGAAVVVDGRGDVAGIFTERDLLRAIADSRDPDQDPVRSHMTADPITLPSDHAPSEAAQIMSERKFRHIPVVDQGQLVGIVSIRDLVGAGLRIQPADAHMGTDFP